MGNVKEDKKMISAGLCFFSKIWIGIRDERIARLRLLMEAKVRILLLSRCGFFSMCTSMLSSGNVNGHLLAAEAATDKHG